MNDTNRDSTSMIFMRGLLVGAVVAVLFAPRSGEQMRRNIKEKVDDMKKKLKDSGNQAVDKVDETLEEAQSKLQRTRDKTAKTGASI